MTGFYQKSTIIDPPYFLASAMVNTSQKLSILEKKSKITIKFVKNHDFFQKNLIFVTSTSPLFWRSIHAPDLRPVIAILWKSPRRLILWQFFGKCQLRMFFVRRTHDIRNFSMLKKQKFLNCDFWPRKCSKWPNLVPGAIKNMFWAHTKILKIFDFWT